MTRAEDAAAETMARALVSRRRVGRMEHRSAWVARVAANVAIDDIRRLRRGQGRPQPSGPDAADTAEEATLRQADHDPGAGDNLQHRARAARRATPPTWWSRPRRTERATRWERP